MPLMQISIEWSARDKIKKLPVDQWRRLKAALPKYFKEKQPDELDADAPDDGPAEGREVGYGDQIIDDVEAEVLTDCGIQFTVERFKGNTHPRSFRGYGGVDAPPNSVVHFHLPNFSLFSVSEVLLMEDACTDALQDRLKEGWRIIAVCPPLNARRPDYILGKCAEATRER